MRNGIDLVDTPQVRHLPQALLDQIVRLDAVFVGTHNTLKCYFDNGQVWYLKTARTKLASDSLQYEADITQHLNSQPHQHLSVPKVTWRDNKGMSLATEEIVGALMSRELLLTMLPLVVDALIEAHTTKLEQVSPATWTITQLKQEIDSVLTTRNDQWQLKQKFEAIKCLMDNNENITGCFKGLVHGDLNLGNILMTPDHTKVGLLDWECAQYTDVRWDLASIIVEFELNELQTQKLLLSYVQQFNLTAIFDKSGSNELAPNEFVQGAQHWIEFYRLTCLCWALKHNHPLRLYQ